MKFLVDAQLPITLKGWLTSQGFDAIHTADLPKQNLQRIQKLSIFQCRKIEF